MPLGNHRQSVRSTKCGFITELRVNLDDVVLLFYVHGKHLRSCRDGQLT